jgi:hypothetical protein
MDLITIKFDDSFARCDAPYQHDFVFDPSAKAILWVFNWKPKPPFDTSFSPWYIATAIKCGKTHLVSALHAFI